MDPLALSIITCTLFLIYSISVSMALIISESRLQRSYELLDREMDISFRLFAENELLKRNKGKYGKK